MKKTKKNYISEIKNSSKKEKKKRNDDRTYLPVSLPSKMEKLFL